MAKSLGFVEITGVTAAIDAIDIMCKSANVELESWERKLGGRLVTVIISGEVAAVTQAVQSAVQNAIKKPVAHAVIANPHKEIWAIVETSKKRISKTSTEKDTNAKLSKQTKLPQDKLDTTQQN